MVLLEHLELLDFLDRRASPVLLVSPVKQDLLVFQVNPDFQARRVRKVHKALLDLKANRDPSVHQGYQGSLAKEV